MRIELHIGGILWDSAETTPDKLKWQTKELKNKWPREIKAYEWEIYIVHQSNPDNADNSPNNIHLRRYDSMVGYRKYVKRKNR